MEKADKINQNKQSKYQNICQVTHISLGFLFLYVAFNSTQNLTSILLDQDGYGKLGFYSLGVQAIFQGIGSLMSSGIVNKFGVKTSMVLGALFNSSWVLQSLIPAQRYYNQDSDNWAYSETFYYIINIIVSAASGFMGSILWVAEGKYISECATEETKGFYFSYFWMFYMQSQVFGNLIAALVLGEMDQVSYFIIMSVIAFIASISFAFLRQPKKVATNEEVSISLFTPENINLSSAHNRESTPDFNSSAGLLQSQMPKKRGFWNDVHRVWSLMISKRMLLFLPQLLWIGVSIAIYSGLLVTIIQTSLTEETIDKKNEKSMLALVAFGFGEIFGALIIGQIVDRVNSRIASLFNCLFIAIATILTIIFLKHEQYNWFTFLMAFMWGVEDGSANTHALEMLGFEFDDNTDPFAIFSMFEALAVFIFQIIQSRVNDTQKFIIYIAVVGGVGTVMCGATYFFSFKEKRSNNKELMNQEQ
ncbi:major facilitator superfamily protein [Stylonychia lemnae]|uniref:Major facilitator superfamily protein n=1 Tax=Stylonychia lemnae TaxID=5949 RepID=A0A078ADG5_STYLE|nr:major facilitator superfamily protein [Stylonychia lemnae]|eukprot:CDW79582.1 major facilitator superfamily protein [Stylonychia lemnae]